MEAPLASQLSVLTTFAVLRFHLQRDSTLGQTCWKRLGIQTQVAQSRCPNTSNTVSEHVLRVLLLCSYSAPLTTYSTQSTTCLQEHDVFRRAFKVPVMTKYNLPLINSKTEGCKKVLKRECFHSTFC